MSTSNLQDNAIVIIGAGAQTPVGRYVLAAAAAVRCGISAYAEHPFMIDKHGEPMVVARADWLDETLPIDQRILTLAVDAAREALHPITPQFNAVSGKIRLHLALSSENLPNPLHRQDLISRFIAQLGFLPAQLADPVVEAHAGGFLALQHAVDELGHGRSQLCLVGGADSWLDPLRLESLDFSNRLHSINYSWGFTPGEGAGFCLLTTAAHARRLSTPPLAELSAVFTSLESNLMGAKSVCTGQGLTAAFRGVLSSPSKVSHSYCDFNGETYRADEYGFTICRTSQFFQDAGSFTSPAESWGDVGAASAPLALTLPLAAWSRRYAKGPTMLAWSSSAASPLRGAVLVRQVSN